MKNNKLEWLVIFLAISFAILSSCSNPPPSPPLAKVVPHSDTLFNDIRVDNYYWLRDRENPGVIQYLEAENAYTEAMMQHTKKLQEELFQEMKARIQETDLSVPEKVDDYFYYSRTEEGKQYKIYCRKKGSLEADEEVILDQNILAEGTTYFDLGTFSVSPNHKLLAYSVDTNGSENFTLYVKNLETGELLPDTVAAIYYPVEWGNDNQTLFYTTLDETQRPYRLFRHRLGTDPARDELVFQENDLSYHLNLSKTKSRKYILLSLESQVTTEFHLLDADRPTGKFKLISRREYGVEYWVEHHGKHLFMVTNDGAKNFKIVQSPISRPQKRFWKDFVPHNKNIKIDAVDMFAHHMAIYQRENGYRTLRIYNFDTGEFHTIEFTEPVYTIRGTKNPEYNTNIVRFNYWSLVTPKTVYDYNMDDRTRKLLKQTKVLGGYNPENYESRRILAPAPDGTQIPISMVYRKGIQLDGSNPLLLTGYGAYGISRDPFFSTNRISLLDRGFIYAIAHVRGGGEMGRFWYENGKFLKKKNTFADFIACAEMLIADGYTSPEKLAIAGGSAGGLLIGAVVNMRPELFKAALAHVPFVDVLNTMLDESIPLTVIEYDEWGNPHKEEFYHYMKSYAPYENVETKDYPNMLVTAGLNDPRVGYWEPAKWVAKLRALKTDQNWLLLKTKMGSGHMGVSGRYDYLREEAFNYAFVLDRLGVK